MSRSAVELQSNGGRRVIIITTALVTLNATACRVQRSEIMRHGFYAKIQPAHATLTFDPLIPITCATEHISTKFDVYVIFRSRVMGPTGRTVGGTTDVIS